MKMIDKALRLFGVYRSIDQVFEEAWEEREKGLVCVHTDFLPNTIKTIQDVLAAAEMSEVRVVCTIGSSLCACRDTIYVDYAAEAWTEPQRVFAIGHELGHVVGGHSKGTFNILRQAIPGWTHPLGIKKALHATAAERTATSHQHEYEADRYATLIMMRMGYSLAEITEAFSMFGDTYTTLTHPSSDRRIEAITWYHENVSISE